MQSAGIEKLMDRRRVEKIYSAYSGIYDLIFGGVLEPRIVEGIRAMGVKKGDRVLEVGVGTGLSLSHYPHNCEVIGVDLSKKMIEKAQKKKRALALDHVFLNVMNAEHLGFPDESFDHVFAAFVITTTPDPRKILSEIARVVKKGGQVVLLNHFMNSHPLVGKIEGFINPIFTRLGWRTDVILDHLLEDVPLHVVSVCKFRKIDPWKIFFLSKERHP